MAVELSSMVIALVLSYPGFQRAAQELTYRPGWIVTDNLCREVQMVGGGRNIRIGMQNAMV